MSKKKTDMEMLKGLIGQYITAHPEGAEEIEEIIEELDPCINCEVHYCNDCPNWHGDEEHYDLDNKDEKEAREEDENEYYKHNECEGVDGCCEDCEYWNWGELCCELDDETEAEDEDEGSKEHKQIEELSKFITSIGTVLGGNMGLLVFDKSNKKDMEKLAAIFGEYAKRLS